MKKIKLMLFVVVAVVLLFTAFAAYRCVDCRTANTEAVRLYLPEGTTYKALCDTLLLNHVARLDGDRGWFHLKARLLGLDKRVRTGSYVVQPNMRELDLIRKLRNGQQDPVRLTIGRFRTPEQLNGYLNRKLMHNEFNVTLDSFYLIRPNTYEFYWTVTPETFMERMEREWKAESEKWKVESGKLSARDIVTLASIVEEETNNNGEKPLIASVYLNRLRRGIPLQADPTVKYAVGDFTLRRILNRHLATDSPFNTYLHTGLPPAPICLPSAASVDAVLNAPETNYLYFCASDQMDGTHRFAATLAEHNRNAAAFHAALNRKGIR